MIGEFQPMWGASTLGIVLKSDGHYYELGFLTRTPSKIGRRDVGEAVDGIGPIDTGTWFVREGSLTLRSENPMHAVRVFMIQLKADTVLLRSRNETYFKPNKSPLPASTSVTPRPSASVVLRRDEGARVAPAALVAGY